MKILYHTRKKVRFALIFEDISFLENVKTDDLKKFINHSSKRDKKDIEFTSSMMVNPLNLKHINKIDETKAQLVILNLEDGIAKESKKRALLLCSIFLSNLKTDKQVAVRVNPIDEGGREEIEFLNSIKPDAIRVAKVKDIKDIDLILDILDQDIDLHISLETKEAFYQLPNLNKDRRIKVAYLGILDLLNDLDLPQSILNINNPTIHYILSKFLIDGKIADIKPVGFVYQEYKNLDRFKEWCELEKSMGYEAKVAIGPKQVDIINEVFKNSDDEKRARYIKEVFEKKQKEGISGFLDERYGFIDEPIYKDALLVLQRIEKFS